VRSLLQIQNPSSSSDKQIQTEAPKETLDKKLQSLNEELFARAESGRLFPFKSMQERLVKIEKEYEDKYQKLLREQLERFKETELSRLKIEEANKYREQISFWTQEQEKKYQERYEKLKQRELETLEVLKKKEMDISKEDFEQRQKFFKNCKHFDIKMPKLRDKRNIMQRNLRYKKIGSMKERTI